MGGASVHVAFSYGFYSVEFWPCSGHGCGARGIDKLNAIRVRTILTEREVERQAGTRWREAREHTEPARHVLAHRQWSTIAIHVDEDNVTRARIPDDESRHGDDANASRIERRALLLLYNSRDVSQTFRMTPKN